MKNDNLTLIVAVAIILLSLSMMPFGRMMGYGSGWGVCGMMGNWNYGSGGYGLGMLITWLTNTAILVLIVVGIVWLVSQMFPKEKRK